MVTTYKSVFSRWNAYYTYGFPIVSHCCARSPARSRKIPVTIDDRTKGPSEIAANRPYGRGRSGPQPMANIVRQDEPFVVKRQSTMQRVWAPRTTNNDLPVSVWTCVNHRYDIGPIVAKRGRRPALDNGLEISPHANISRRLTPVADSNCFLKVYGSHHRRPARLIVNYITLSIKSVKQHL